MVTSISTALAIYFVLWWVVLFVTLPFGVRSQHEDGEGAPGTDPGAPVASADGPQADLDHADLGGDLRASAMLAYRAGYLNIERLSKLMGFPL